MIQKNFLKILLLFFVGFISNILNAQSPGDIAFIAFNADGIDNFAFVALADIPANTSIWFTDNEWDGIDRFNNTNEGEIKWSYTAVLTAGSIVAIAGNAGGAATITNGLGTVTGSGLNLSPANETLYALLSEPISIAAMPTPGFLAGISNDLSGDGVGVLTSTGLTDGINFIDFDNDKDGFKYSGLKNGQHAFSGYLPKIMNKGLWQIEASIGGNILPISGTSFTIINATWNGSSDNNWETAANWTPAIIPTSTSDVLIPNGLTRYPTISNVVSVESVTLESGATLVTRFSPSFTGIVTYKRSLVTDNWYLVSSPVSGETIENLIANHTFATGTGGGRIGLAPYDNFETTGGLRWDYQVITSTGPVLKGIGYSVKLNAPGDVSFTGTLHTDDVPIALTQGTLSGGNDFNLIGNPYTAYINSGTFLTEEGINNSNITSATLWLWNQGVGPSGAYEAKIAADNFKIAPGQSFFVEANSGNNVTFTEAMQSHQATETFQRSKPKIEVHLFVNDKNYNSRHLKIYYTNQATRGFDNGFDGELFRGFSNPFAIYSQLISNNNGKNYQIQSLPDSDIETTIIPIGVDAIAGKEITFSSETLNLPSKLKVFLEDRKTNTFARLDKGKSNYKVTLTQNLNGVGRFYLHLAQSALSSNNFILNTVSIYKTDATTLKVAGLPIGKTNLSLFSTIGKQVYSTTFESNGIKNISLPKLQTGVYFVKVQTGSGKINKKIIL